MPYRTLWMLLGLTLGLAAAPAAADFGSEDLDDVDTGESHSLDSVDTGRSRSLDSVDVGRSEDVDAVDTGRSEDLDAVDTGRSDDPNPAKLDRGWEPPSCSRVAVNLGETPPGSDSTAWSQLLRDARRRISTSEQAITEADAAYSRSINFEYPIGQARADIIQSRETAREEFSRARCTLPLLVERGRRAGVSQAVLRPYL